MDGPVTTPFISRNAFLQQLACGAGSIALAQMLAREGRADESPLPELNGGLHHPAKVKRIIQLFMNGGASPMDLFDYKPELERLHGQMLGPKEKPEGFVAPAGAVMKSPFAFQQHGESGRWVSSLFPEQAKHVDDMAFLMAMTTKTNVHGPGSYMMNTGFLLPGFPCMGAWISYALGSLSDNLPSFVVLPDPRGLPYNSKGNFSAGFLPAKNQGTLINGLRPNPFPISLRIRSTRLQPVTPIRTHEHCCRNSIVTMQNSIPMIRAWRPGSRHTRSPRKCS